MGKRSRNTRPGRGKERVTARRPEDTGRAPQPRPHEEALPRVEADRRDHEFGPYETRYSVQHGYGVDRVILRP